MCHCLKRRSKAPQCVVVVMGAHAGEDADAVFGRKIEDCRIVGRTFWVAKSAKARPAQVQAMCRSGSSYAIFVEREFMIIGEAINCLGDIAPDLFLRITRRRTIVDFCNQFARGYITRTSTQTARPAR